jgi:hypothetical protein
MAPAIRIISELAEKLFGQTAIFLLPTAFAVLLGYLLRRWFIRKRFGRKNLLPREAPRGPGESLREKIARLDEKIKGNAAGVAIIPIWYAAFVLYPAARSGAPVLSGAWKWPLLLCLILLVFLFRRLSGNIEQRANYRLSLDAELAVGRELDQIMAHGFHVFHDFPEEGYNIAHVVAGKSGIFAVKSKGWPKSNKGGGLVDAKVLFTGDALYFPDNAKETAAVAQARKQAGSLAKWLSGAVGETVEVRPALALPGWFIERKQADDLLLLCGQSRHYAHILKGKGQGLLTEQLLERIVHQLDAKSRNPEPQTRTSSRVKQKKPIRHG